MKNQTIEGNRLIAEFMGIKLKGGGKSVFDNLHLHLFRKTDYKQDGLCKWCGNDVSHGHDIRCYTIDDEKLLYHSSWDWIMAVVEKIESMNYDFNILTPNVVQVIDSENMVDIMYLDMQEGTKLQGVYDAVIEFIIWYNQNKQP